MKNLDGFGSCFKQAFQKLEQNSGALLVHAIITNPSGKKIVHAWLEYSAGEEMVYDPSVSLAFTKKFYYEGYKPILISKYNLQMARVLAVESDIYGPWEPVLIIFMEKMRVPTRNETEHSRRWKKELVKNATKGKKDAGKIN